MFNFSANNMVWISTRQGERYFVHHLMDEDTKRYFRLYDFEKALVFQSDMKYCVFGKVNSADKIYLVAEKMKIKQKNPV
jgi:hypothetical protein